MAVAASMLTIVYHMIRDKTEHQDLGPYYFADRDSTRTAERLANRFRELGIDVQLQNIA
jgi:transposase